MLYFKGMDNVGRISGGIFVSIVVISFLKIHPAYSNSDSAIVNLYSIVVTIFPRLHVCARLNETRQKQLKSTDASSAGYSPQRRSEVMTDMMQAV